MDHAFASKGIIDGGLIGLGFGAYLGLLCHAKWHPGMLKKVIHRDEHHCKAMVRLILGLVVCGVVGGLLYFVISDLPTNIYAIGLLKTFIPTTFVSWYMFYPHDLLCAKLGLLCFEEKFDDDKSEEKG